MSKERRRPITQHDKESGARIKELRIKDFGTQKIMGDFLGVTMMYISLIERGERRLMPDDRFKLVKDKKWSMEYIDFGKGKKYVNKDYLKDSTEPNIGDLALQIDILRSDIEKYREDYNRLLKIVQDHIEEVRK